MAPGPEVPEVVCSSFDNPLQHHRTTEVTDIAPLASDTLNSQFPRISLARLLRGDEDEEDRLWHACCELGFFYIDLRQEEDDEEEEELDDGGAVQRNGRKNSRQIEIHVDGEQLLDDADRLLEAQKSFFELPVEEKMKYDFSGQGSEFGYQATSTPDPTARSETYNIPKDAILSSTPTPFPTPLLTSFTRESHSLAALTLRILDARLSLPTGTLPSLHRLTAPSGSHVRLIRTQAPADESSDSSTLSVLFASATHVLQPAAVDRSARKDSCLSNGKAPSAAAQTWIPAPRLPGHALLALGDALVQLTNGGELRSGGGGGAYRVEGGGGVVYVARPEDEVVARVMEEGGGIGEEVRRRGEAVGRERERAVEWVERRKAAAAGGVKGVGMEAGLGVV